jgi:hypothetical protein
MGVDPFRKDLPQPSAIERGGTQDPPFIPEASRIGVPLAINASTDWFDRR